VQNHRYVACDVEKTKKLRGKKGKKSQFTFTCLGRERKGKRKAGITTPCFQTIFFSKMDGGGGRTKAQKRERGKRKNLLWEKGERKRK